MDDVRDAGETVTKEAEKARERVRSIADEAIKKGKEGWSELKTRGEDALDDVKLRGSYALDDAQELVKRYPFQAIGLGILVGVAFGALIAGRDNE